MNMSYCRFQNTSQDLQDCLDKLEECGYKKTYETSSEYEQRALKEMRRMCEEFLDLCDDDY